MSKRSIKLSVALAVHNEADFLVDCLESVREIADEVVVVDAQSTDETVAIAHKYSCRVLSAPHVAMFHQNKQLALNACSGKWILMLDADERVTPELAKEIQRVIDGNAPKPLSAKQQKLFLSHQQNVGVRDGVGYVSATTTQADAYFLSRKNFFLRGYLLHGGVFPDGVIRLVKKGVARFPCKSVHEQPSISGTVGWLNEPLVHNSDPTAERYWMRANRYTTLTAKDMADKQVPISILSAVQYLVYKPLQTFFWLYIRHKGILDGTPGFLWALFSAMHFQLAYFKYWERTRG